MRANPAEYEIAAPGNLPGVLRLLGEAPGRWQPIAGGTDLMVVYSAGKLAARRFVSVWNLPELRCIDVSAEEVKIGAGCTYTDLRRHAVIAKEFPLLARAASWTGSIANQNRGTIGGNIANASPAADSLPPLLAYDAEIVLISARGERRVAYAEFHTGYKKMTMEADELIFEIRLPRRFTGWTQYSRKVGARNAQAISKVCLAALGRVNRDAIEEVRLALGSVAPIPLRLRETERVLAGAKFDNATMERAKKALESEIRPIDDIRSTARYRTAVASNLLAEFLEMLAAERGHA